MLKFKNFCAAMAFFALVLAGALITSALGMSASLGFVTGAIDTVKAIFGGQMTVKQIVGLVLVGLTLVGFIALVIVSIVKKKTILLPISVLLFGALVVASIWKMQGILALLQGKVCDVTGAVTAIQITKVHALLAFGAWWLTVLFFALYVVLGLLTIGKAPAKAKEAAPAVEEKEECECCQEEEAPAEECECCHHHEEPCECCHEEDDVELPAGHVVTIVLGSHAYKARLFEEGECECCPHHEEPKPVEEPVEEPAPVEETPAPVVVEEAPAEEEGNAFPTIKTKSFEVKFKEADKELRAKYSELKNELLKHKNVRSRLSSTFDSYRIGRKLLAKISLAGKHIKLSLALDPKDYDVSKYHHVDVSGKKKFAEVPMQLRIQSDLSLRKALALIDELCEKNGAIVNKKHKDVDYSTKNGLEK